MPHTVPGHVKQLRPEYESPSNAHGHISRRIPGRVFGHSEIISNIRPANRLVPDNAVTGQVPRLVKRTLSLLQSKRPVKQRLHPKLLFEETAVYKVRATRGGDDGMAEAMPFQRRAFFDKVLEQRVNAKCLFRGDAVRAFEGAGILADEENAREQESISRVCR